MADHKLYAENGRTIIQKVGDGSKRIVRVDVEIDTVNNSVFLQNVSNKGESWTMKYDEVLDKLGVKVDPTGTDEDTVIDYVTTATVFNSTSGGSGVSSVNGYTGVVNLGAVYLNSNATITKNGSYGIDTSAGSVDITINDNTATCVFLFDSHGKWGNDSCFVDFVVETDTFELDKKEKEYEFSFDGSTLRWFEYGKKVK